MSKHLPPQQNKHEKEPESSIFNTPLREQMNVHSRDELNESMRKNSLFCLGATAFLIAGLVMKAEAPVGMILLGLSLACSGYQVALRAAEELMGLKLLESDLLVLLSAAAAFALGLYAQGAILMLSYRLIRMAEGYFGERRKGLRREFGAHLPKEAHVVQENDVRDVEPEQIAEDDILEVRVNEVIPVDGVVIEGDSAVDVSAYTGGSATFPIGVDSRVLCGCVNRDKTIRIRATGFYAESGAVLIQQLVEKAERYRSRIDKFSERFEHYFTPVLVLTAILCGVVVPVFSGDWRLWLSRGATLLGLSACRGLAISVSNAYSAALLWAKKRGILFKGVRFFEALAKAKTFVFNKTGTLTDGRYQIMEVVPKDIEEEELLSLAANAESSSSHPIARAICSAYGLLPEDTAVKCCEEIPGRGVIAELNGKKIYVGNAAHLDAQGIACPAAKKGGTAIHVAVNKTYAGYLLLSDHVRESAFDQLEMLRIQGVKNMITLTSDLRSVARPLASSLNMDMLRAELTMEGKISAVEYLGATKAEHSSLAYVCNGDSDAEILQRADVGVSLGAVGCPGAYEYGDVLIMDQRLGAVAESLGISRFVSRVVLLNVTATVLIKLLLACGAIFGFVSLTIAAPVMLVLCLMTNGNSLRVLKYDNEVWRKYR